MKNHIEEIELIEKIFKSENIVLPNKINFINFYDYLKYKNVDYKLLLTDELNAELFSFLGDLCELNLKIKEQGAVFPTVEKEETLADSDNLIFSLYDKNNFNDKGEVKFDTDVYLNPYSIIMDLDLELSNVTNAAETLKLYDLKFLVK